MTRTRARGFTMIEILIALVVLSIVLTGALRLFRSVNTAVSGTADRMEAMQQLRFGLSQIDLLLRNAGAGTVNAQPTLVYIDRYIAVFNVDWISLYPGSPTAVNYNPDADPNASNAVTVAQRFTIPTTTVQYPDSTYHSAGGISPAETVIYYFELDTSTQRTDDYHLMRQVNNGVPQEVAKNILPYPGHDFFEWLRTDSAGNLVQVPATALPLRHTVPIHGSLADTSLGPAGAKLINIDSIRAVRLYATATNGLTGTQEIRRALVTTVRIPNAGLALALSCGDAPIFNQTVTVTQPTVGVNSLRVQWPPGVDEYGGAKKIERYLVYRRTLLGTFDDALAEVAAGLASYTYDDPTVLKDSTYVYGVTALDCTPTESARSTSNAQLVQ